jgi:hypothetical protein
VIAALALVGGVAVATPTYAVALCEGDSWFDCEVICGGTLVAPNVVVTARHCADTRGAEALDCATYRFDGPLKPEQRIWVTDASPVSNRARFEQGAHWDIPLDRTCGHDLAVLRLGSPVDATPANVGAEAHDHVDLYGFGLSAPSAPPSPERRNVQSRLLCAGGRDSCTVVPNARDLMPTELVFDATVCPGDSGSGAFVGDALIGPLSRSVGGTSPCGYGVYVDLEPHLPLLARATRDAAAIGHYPAPAWTQNVSLHGFGETCDSDADCESGQCRTDDNLTWRCECDGCLAKTSPGAAGCQGAPGNKWPMAPALFLLVCAVWRLRRR